MQLSHTRAAMSAVFDDPNLVGAAGLVPVVGLCDRIGLGELAQDWIRVPGLGRANAGTKVMSLVVGMVAGADSIDDLDVLRHGGMDRLFTDGRAPATVGQFLRSFSFGHVRQFDAVASRVLLNLCQEVPGLVDLAADVVFLDIDDTIRAVYGISKQGAEHGYTKVRGLNAQLAAVSSGECAPVITGARLRRGAVSSGHGAVRMILDSIAAIRRTGYTGRIVVRADSAYYSSAIIAAIIKAGAEYSITVRQDRAVRRGITQIPDDGWTPITYTQAIPDPETGELISAAEVAEISYTAFTSKPRNKQVTGRLIVRRVPELNKTKLETAGQQGLFTVYRYHALITSSTGELVAVEKSHRGHAIIESVIADLKSSALAHLPSRSFNANAAWLVAATIAFNITRAIGVLAKGRFTKAETATTRERIIKTPARIASSGRRTTLHLPTRWPRAPEWTNTWTAIMTT
jgi:hypothetical protein